MFKHFKEKCEELREKDEEIRRLKNRLDDFEKESSHQLWVQKEKEKSLIAEALETQRAKIQKLEIENGIQKEKINILQKAFENMGFDVKDMKQILEKLVDGLIAKNEIKLIK